ncbi:MAG: hypothetical protein HY722_09525 [Planctomycetes bacterium]|nr:hypothetical protein [Planctomycetota bacterium]
MQVEIHDRQDVLVARLEGPCTEFKAYLRPFSALVARSRGGPRRVLVDLSHLSQVSTAGLFGLEQLYREVQRNLRQEVRLHSPSAPLARLLADRPIAYPVHRDEAEAMASLGAPDRSAAAPTPTPTVALATAPSLPTVTPAREEAEATAGASPDDLRDLRAQLRTLEARVLGKAAPSGRRARPGGKAASREAAEIRSELEAMGRRLTDLTRERNAVFDRNQELGRRVLDLEGERTRSEEALRVLQEGAEAAAAERLDLESRLATSEVRRSALEGRLSGMSPQLAALAEGLARLAEAHADATESLRELAASTGDLLRQGAGADTREAHLGRVEEALSRVHAASGPRVGRAGGVEGRLQEALSETLCGDGATEAPGEDAGARYGLGAADGALEALGHAARGPAPAEAEGADFGRDRGAFQAMLEGVRENLSLLRARPGGDARLVHVRRSDGSRMPPEELRRLAMGERVHEEELLEAHKEAFRPLLRNEPVDTAGLAPVVEQLHARLAAEGYRAAYLTGRHPCRNHAPLRRLTEAKLACWLAMRAGLAEGEARFLALSALVAHHDRSWLHLRAHHRGALAALRVVEAYEGLCSPRDVRLRFPPRLAMQGVVMKGDDGGLDARWAHELARALSLYPVGSWVELEDGPVGRVVAAHPRDLTRPVVELCFDPSGLALDPPRAEDLSLRPALRIRGAVELPER